MVSYDIRKFDPFFVGADRLWRHIDDLHRMADSAQTTKYPPYNIRKDDEDHYSIEMAVAGFTEQDLDVTIEDGKLTITGKVEQEDGGNLLHRGIANRAFTRQFTLADTIEVEGADLEHGMLKITLKNIIPDHKKAKQIPVKTGGKLLEGEKQLLTE